MKREWRTLLLLILLNVTAFGAVGYFTGIAPRMRAVAELKADAKVQIESLAALMSRLPPASRISVIAQIPTSLGTRVLMVERNGTVMQDSAAAFTSGARIERSELAELQRGRPVITVERLPSGRYALYAFAVLDDDLVLIQTRRAEGVTLTETLTLVGLFLLTSIAQSLAIYGLARYRRNEEKRQLEERLALAGRHETAQREFVANAAHELRTPVWSIKLFAAELATDEKAHAVAPYVEPIVRASDRLSALVTQLLDLSNMEAGVLELHPTWVDVETWLAGIGRMMTPQVQAAQAHLTWECHGAAQAWFDSGLLGQAVSNLVENGLKHGGQGVSVKISAQRQGEALRIDVQDTGPGIAPEHLPHIFERFYRADKDRSRKKGGAGLGLAIARSIAQLHGGTLGVQSEVGIGTTMSISIPQTQS